MSRDNILFVVLGLLLGFIAGYVLHEAMAARQPPRLVPGQAAVAPAAAGAPGTGGPAAGGPAAGAPAAAGPAAGGPAIAEVQELRQRLEQNPDDREALRRLAGLNFQISNWQRAVELFERYLELEPGDAEAMTDLGVGYRALGNIDRALELFREAYGLDPTRWQAAYNEAYVLAFDRGDFTAAATRIETLRARQPDNPDVEQLAREIAQRRGDDPPPTP